MRKEDPRAIRTKQMLQQAVYELIKQGERPEALTVQKVTKTAQLNRTTFYLHYKDIPDLVEQLHDEAARNLNHHVSTLLQNSQHEKEEKLEQFLIYLSEQKAYMLQLFQVERFEKQLFEEIKRLIEIRREQTTRQSENLKIDINVRTASLVGIIVWWLKSDAAYTPQFITKQIQHFYRTK